MKGGGSRVPYMYSEKWFFKKTFRIIPWLWKRVFHLAWALYYVYIVVEVTMNMTEYGSRWSQQAANVNFEPIITGLRSENFDWDQV